MGTRHFVTFAIALVSLLLPRTGECQCLDDSFSCFRDCCKNARQFCDSAQERCVLCETKQALCGSLKMPHECAMYCHNLEHHQSKPSEKDLLASRELSIAGIIALTLFALTTAVVVTCLLVRCCFPLWWSKLFANCIPNSSQMGAVPAAQLSKKPSTVDQDEENNANCPLIDVSSPHHVSLDLDVRPTSAGESTDVLSVCSSNQLPDLSRNENDNEADVVSLGLTSVHSECEFLAPTSTRHKLTQKRQSDNCMQTPEATINRKEKVQLGDTTQTIKVDTSRKKHLLNSNLSVSTSNAKDAKDGDDTATYTPTDRCAKDGGIAVSQYQLANNMQGGSSVSQAVSQYQLANNLQAESNLSYCSNCQGDQIESTVLCRSRDCCAVHGQKMSPHGCPPRNINPTTDKENIVRTETAIGTKNPVSVYSVSTKTC